ncbi:heme exporter protein CcmD [Rhodobacteraceae bacterium RKSG542]|uniref:heme exporter protein CcmD n=1 Tax=Pseudovibrio flavus TaxID=2529854 RepID=UPI0012BC3C1E|nr:heme exporter protein CcmD [Pseudovibrio flavus]MTI18398.1 heme exporter protein CcmD [Pseudovibrio flavus]
MDSFFADLPRHAEYVAAVYLMAVAVFGGLLTVALVVKKQRVKELAELEAAGIRRRSAKKQG